MSSFGFGANNNNNTGSFGSGGFGSGGTGFGANNNASTGASLFGGNTATSGGAFGFGANNAANNNNSPFGQNKTNTGFGASTSGGGSLFGNNTASTGTFGSGGGFGSNNNTNNTTSAFGANAGGGLFGNKPATTGFGASTSGGSLFASGSTPGTFGSTANNAAGNPFSTNTNSTTNTTSGFGASTNTGGFGGFGANNTAGNNNNGTAAVPFQAFTEKEGNTNSTAAYQSISFQDPYKTKSFEELRVEDYMQGRRYGNTNGQAGGFGQSTGFGGFGATNNTASSGTSLFGGNNTAAATNTGNTGFGGFGSTNNNTTSTFGASNTSGGLFGANKPATGGLFGAAPAASTTSAFGASTPASGGLFGANNNSTATNTGFGATNNTSGSLFGGTNNTAQSTGFGSTATTGGGLFGNNATQNKPGTSLFGGTTNTNTTGGLFGAQNNTQQQGTSLFGGGATNNTGASLFGGNNTQQAKPAGFGGFGASTTNTGGSAFGANTANTGTSLFGNSGNQNTTGSSLFGGNQAAKPSLFGAPATGNNGAGNSLFGGSQQQTGASLFGGNTANNAAGNSLFGNTQNKSLFGNSGTTNTGGTSLFGNSQQQQGNTGGMSLFGGNQSNSNSLLGNGMQQQPTQNQLHASLTISPYGNDQLFASLAAPAPPVGPLATPLQGAKPTPKKSQSLLGSMRVNSPVYTPRASTVGRATGYGISYSNFATPTSSYSGTLTPGASSLLRPTGSFNSALTSRLSKSFSTSNLRAESTDSGSLLRPNPLTPGSMAGRYGSGSMRKLRIDRSIRQDLFDPSPRDDGRRESDVRRVNFESSNDDAGESSTAVPTANNALITEDRAREERVASEQKSTLFKSDPRAATNGNRAVEQTNGAGPLSTVPENGVPRPGSAPVADLDSPNNTGEPGAYWTKPSIDSLKRMSRKQLEKVDKFTVGRNGVGHIVFHSCDLSTVPLDDICDKIVELVTRNATVYPKDINKPPVGQGLNVPSEIVLEHSWPKAARGKKMILDVNSKAYKSHIKRLQEVKDTKFISYDQENGAWTFRVEHFTTYALDDEDDDDDMTEQSSPMSDAPETPISHHDDTIQSIEPAHDDMDDTFQFKFDRKPQLGLPGAFDSEAVSFLDEPMEVENDGASLASTDVEGSVDEDPFVSAGGPVRAPSPRAMTRSTFDDDQPFEQPSYDEDVLLESPSMPGTFVPEPTIPRSILKPRNALSVFASPEKLVTEAWEEQLQRTMSPKKRDRLALKEMQQNFATAVSDPSAENHFQNSVLGQSMFGQSYLASKGASKKGHLLADNALGKSQAFTTSMDIMNSLWANDKATNKAPTHEIQTLNRSRPEGSKVTSDATLHDNVKPHFNPAQGVLSYALPGSSAEVSGSLVTALDPLIGEQHDIRFARFASGINVNAPALAALKEVTVVEYDENDPGAIPFARTNLHDFAQLAKPSQELNNTRADVQEATIWTLCSILFDPVTISCAAYTEGMSPEQIKTYEKRIRADAFQAFWSNLAASSIQTQLSKAKTPEHKALLHLTRNDITSACEVLSTAKDHRLAILVAQLPGSSENRATMATQIDAWRKRKDWSEMSESVRALWSILAGEVCLVPGQDGAPEDRANDFCISEKFELSWQQAFGLRSLFGGQASLRETIQTYCNDLDDERETVTATTSWDHGFEGDDYVDKEDTLMSLLRLYAQSRPDLVTTLLDPLTVAGNALSNRLSWQMAVALSSKTICSLSTESMDRLTLDLSAELESSLDILDAAWVILHVQDTATRHRALLSFLERNADKISSPNESGEGSDFLVLTEYLHIPASLVWAAKATYAASDDAFYHAYWMLQAHFADLAAGYDIAAHDALCASVAPRAIIEEDYERLEELIKAFEAAPRKPEGWETGAGVYQAYLRLLQMRPTHRSGTAGQQALRELRHGLAGMQSGGQTSSTLTLEQRVSILELERFAQDVAREIESDDGPDGEAEDFAMGDASTYDLAPVQMFAAYQRALGVVA